MLCKINEPPITRIVVDINSRLMLAEDILSRYVSIPEYAIFVKGLRDPVDNKAGISTFVKRGLIKNTPWHPYISAFILKEIFYRRVVDLSTTTTADYKINRLTSSRAPIYDINYDIDLHLIPGLYIPDLTEEDSLYIAKECEKIVDVMLNLVPTPENHIIELDITSEHAIINKYSEILSYRYIEALSNAEPVDNKTEQIENEAEGLDNGT